MSVADSIDAAIKCLSVSATAGASNESEKELPASCRAHQSRIVRVMTHVGLRDVTAPAPPTAPRWTPRPLHDINHRGVSELGHRRASPIFPAAVSAVPTEPRTTIGTTADGLIRPSQSVHLQFRLVRRQ